MKKNRDWDQMKIGTLVSRPQTLIVCSIVLELTTRTLEIQKIQCLLKVVSIDEGISSAPWDVRFKDSNSLNDAHRPNCNHLLVSDPGPKFPGRFM